MNFKPGDRVYFLGPLDMCDSSVRTATVVKHPSKFGSDRTDVIYDNEQAVCCPVTEDLRPLTKLEQVLK